MLAAAACVFGGLLLPAVCLAAGTTSAGPDGAAARAVRWGCLIGLAVDLAILVFALIIGVKVSKLFVGTDNRLSTSKTVATLWTLVFAAMLLGIVYANLLNHPQAFNAIGSSGLVGQYALLFGGPLGSAFLAKQIVNTQVTTNAKQPAPSPTAKNLIANDQGEADLGDLQYVLFNLIAFVYVVSTMMHTPLNGLPHIPDTLLGLTSVSAVGYVSKKALAPTGLVTATLTPAEGAVGTAVNIDVKGLAPKPSVLSAMVQFGDASQDGQLGAHADVTDGAATLSVHSPAIGATVNVPISVSVVTADGMVLDAGTYKYTTQ